MPHGHEGFTVPHYDLHMYFVPPEARFLAQGGTLALPVTTNLKASYHGVVVFDKTLMDTEKSVLHFDGQRC